jgi:5-methylcytosine-specific restriction protein A
MPSKEDFRSALKRVLNAAEKAGKPYIEVNAGDLHREVGGYPSKEHIMPSCCDVLYEEHARGRAEIRSSPPKGKGASLTIRYQLPR